LRRGFQIIVGEANLTEAAAVRPGPRAPGCPVAGQHTVPADRAGSGRLLAALVAGQSAALACASSSPLRLLLPRPRGTAVWAVAASHGGGLVGGDTIRLDLELEPDARACLTTQAETKVYRSANLAGRQEVTARVASGGLLALLPEPVSAFAGSAYRQRQAFDLEPGASLVLVDTLVAGRAARGERWAFREYQSSNEVRVGGQLLLADSLRLAAGEGPPVARRLGDHDLLATIVLTGPLVAAPAAALLAALHALPPARDGLLAAASPVGDGLLLRLASRSVEAGLAAIRRHLDFLPALLGEDPLSRRP
jgi:urease accessory protein